MLWAGRSGFQIPEEERDFSLFQNVQTSSEAHTAFYSMSTGFFPVVKVVRA